LAALFATVVLLLGLFDAFAFPGGIPRDIPPLGWKAASDKYIFALVPQEADSKEVFTVCLLGSSLVQKGISAPTVEAKLQEQLGRRCRVFNYAIPGAYMCDMLLALRHVAAIQPDVVVIGTAPRDYPQEETLAPQSTAAFELLAGPHLQVPNFMRVEGIEARLDQYLKDTWSLYKYRNWIRLNSGALFKALADPKADRDRRFFAKRQEVDWALGATNVSRYLQAEQRRYPNCQSRCLEDLVSGKTADAPDFLVVNMPLSSLWSELDNNGVVAQAAQLMRDTSTGAGVDYVDASRLMEDEFFVDASHLNRQGAVAFSAWLADTLAQQQK
jgi:hypothetical protein